MDTTELIYRVLSEQASEAEGKKLLDWLVENPGNREEFENIKLLWMNSPDENQEDSRRLEVWNNIKSALRKRARKRSFR